MLNNFFNSVRNNWFKVALIILATIFLIEFHSFNESFSKADWSGDDINTYYRHKLCEVGGGLPCLR